MFLDSSQIEAAKQVVTSFVILVADMRVEPFFD